MKSLKVMFLSAVFVLMGAGCSLEPEPVTLDQTYTDTHADLGYSVQYPGTWEINPSEKFPGNITLMDKDSTKINDKESFSSNVSIVHGRFGKEPSKTLQMILITTSKGLDDVTQTEPESLTIGGYEAVRAESLQSHERTGRVHAVHYVVRLDDDYGYQLSAFVLESEWAKMKPTIDAIIASFKP